MNICNFKWGSIEFEKKLTMNNKNVFGGCLYRAIKATQDLSFFSFLSAFDQRFGLKAIFSANFCILIIGGVVVRN
jgi:hypothetical protein